MPSNRKIADDDLYAHFLTFNVDHRRRLFTLDRPKRIFLSCLQEELNRHDARCLGFAIMPDHVHLIVWLPVVGGLSRFVHECKRISSFRIRRWYESSAPEYFAKPGPTNRFWKAKYYSFELFSRSKVEEKLQYMHSNPVRAGLVKHPTDWQWSSAGWYESGRSAGIKIEWVE